MTSNANDSRAPKLDKEDARQGSRKKGMLLVLGVSMTLSVVALVVALFFFGGAAGGQ